MELMPSEKKSHVYYSEWKQEKMQIGKQNWLRMFPIRKQKWQREMFD